MRFKLKKIFIIIFSQLLLLGCQQDLPRPFNKAFYHKKENSIKTQSQSMGVAKYRNKEIRPLNKEEEILNQSDEVLLATACKNGEWDTSNNLHVIEAKNRTLDCVVEGIAATFNVSDKIFNNNKNFSANTDKDINNYSDYVICLRSNWKEDYKKYQLEAKRRGLDCGVKTTLVTNEDIVPKSKKNINSNISSAELEKANKRALELERKLAVLEKKQKQEQRRINSDNERPIINAYTKQDGSNAIISGRVTDNIEIAEVLIDGQVQELKSNGTFETDFYVPRSGKTIEIVAYDNKGNKASKILKLERSNIQLASGPSFDALNPSVKRVKSNKNALALIIGVANYEKTPANALYADKDAQQFYDYATMKLGIPSSNIK